MMIGFEIVRLATPNAKHFKVVKFVAKVLHLMKPTTIWDPQFGRKLGLRFFCNFAAMNWLILIIAGLCETGFAFCLGKTKLTVGTEYWLWISGFAALYVLSAMLLAKATQTVPIGIAYPVWTGIGAVGAVLLGIFVFHEPATFWRVFFLSTLILSIVGLKAVS